MATSQLTPRRLRIGFLFPRLLLIRDALLRLSFCFIGSPVSLASSRSPLRMRSPCHFSPYSHGGGLTDACRCPSVEVCAQAARWIPRYGEERGKGEGYRKCPGGVELRKPSENEKQHRKGRERGI